MAGKNGGFVANIVPRDDAKNKKKLKRNKIETKIGYNMIALNPGIQCNICGIVHPKVKKMVKPFQ